MNTLPIQIQCINHLQIDQIFNYDEHNIIVIFKSVIIQSNMDQLIRELTANVDQQQYHLQNHCCHDNQNQFEIPVAYFSNAQQLPKIKSLLDEQQTTQDVRAKLLKYNPSLSQYLNNTSQSITYTPNIHSYGIINITQPYSRINNNQPNNLSIHSQLRQSEYNQNNRNNEVQKIQNNYSQSQFHVISEEPQVNYQNIQSVPSSKKVQKYVAGIKDTRQMADTKFKKYFGKPCFANYGGNNTKMQNGGIVYGQYMKTHNVSPHKNGNHPTTYETYQSALLHANRAILNKNKDQQDIIKQITRKQKQQLESINKINGIIQPKKKQLVDRTQNTQRTNKSLSKNNLSQSIISKDFVNQKDKYIAQTQHLNYENKIKKDYPDHYLVPINDKLIKKQNTKLTGKKIETISTAKSQKHKQQIPKQKINIQYRQAPSYNIIQLAHAETQTMMSPSQKIPVSPKLVQAKSQQSINSNKLIKSNSPSVIQQYSIKIKQPQHILVSKPAPLSNDAPKQLNLKDEYSYQQQTMIAPYQYCLCKHKDCQHKRKTKQQAYFKGIKNSEIGQRIISCAKKASMYTNYLPNMKASTDNESHLNTSPKSKQIKQYYDLPRQRVNPQNYGCQQVEELEQIPYAGKPLRYNYNKT